MRGLSIDIDADDDAVHEDLLAVVAWIDAEIGQRVIDQTRRPGNAVHPRSRPAGLERNGAGKLVAEFQPQLDAGREFPFEIGMTEGDRSQGQGLHQSARRGQIRADDAELMDVLVVDAREEPAFGVEHPATDLLEISGSQLARDDVVLRVGSPVRGVQNAAVGVHEERVVELRVSRAGEPFQIMSFADFLRTADQHPLDAPVGGVVDDVDVAERNRQVLHDVDRRMKRIDAHNAL